MEWTGPSPGARRCLRLPDESARGADAKSRKPPETLPNSAEPPAPLRVGAAVAQLPDGRVVAPDGTVTELRPQSAAVLRALAARRGETVSKAALLDEVWPGIAVTEDSLVQCIGDIRRALGSTRDAVRTLPKRGYRLDLDAAPAAPRGRVRALTVCAGILCAALVALALWQRLPASTVPRQFDGPVVAVLPFENLSEPGRWDRLARGVTEEVMADATTRPHAGETPQAVGRALGARYVVTGTVQAEGERVNVTSALADTASGRQVWAKQWAAPADDLLAIQAAASEALVGELAGRYSGAVARAETARAHGAGTASLDAYELYLLAVERKQKHGFALADLVAAEDYLKRAVRIDPAFARAWAVLSLIQGMKTSSATTDAEFDALHEQQRAYLARAVEADPEDPATLIEVAKVAARHGDEAAFARTLRRAIALAPNDADILAAAAWVASQGAPIGPDALGWAERAIALNPAGPGWYRTALGIAAFAVGDYGQAAEALASDPSDFPDRLLYLAAAEAVLGHADRAGAAGDRLRDLVPDFDLTFYMDGWPWEPGHWQRLHDAAVRAGLGKEPSG
jgi:TolB-like protein